MRELARDIELMPVDGKLPEDIEARINEILERNKPDLWIRWFGGTLNVKIFGDPRSFHYKFGRRSKDGHWKLKKAWSTIRWDMLLRNILFYKEFPVCLSVRRSFFSFSESRIFLCVACTSLTNLSPSIFLSNA